ncbi:MAG: hypothetical protein JJT89_11010 [Nitriliruptoraceae bacterium]|nr:hypothetical protein [Nitriliruptoraceae bacterium]
MSRDPGDEIDELRDRVRVLTAGLGLAETFEIPRDARRHAEAGRTVAAVRELRRQTPGRLSLVTAKRMIDALQR